MALVAPTALTTITSITVGTTSGASASVSPTANALLLVAAMVGSGSNVPTLSISDTFAGTGAWTKLQVQDTGTGLATTALFYAIAGSAPGAGTVTITSALNCNRWAVLVDQITGQNATTPIPQSATGGPVATATLTTAALASTPAATSATIGVLGSRTTTFAAGTSYTNLNSQITNSIIVELEYNLFGQLTTASWSGLGTTSNLGLVAEIQVAAATAPFPPWPPSLLQLPHYRL